MQSFIQVERKGKKNYTIIHIFLLLFRRKEREKRTMPSSTRSLLFQLIFIFYNSVLQFSFERHLISKPVYVGIWYDTNLIPDRTVIWVANRYKHGSLSMEALPSWMAWETHFTSRTHFFPTNLSRLNIWTTVILCGNWGAQFYGRALVIQLIPFSPG